MIYINEWFPNPIGADASSEFVEFYNSASGTVSLAGWKLGAGTASATAIIPAKTKPVSLAKFSVPPRGYLVLEKAQDKLTLKNIDGALLLYGPSGTVVDRASFAGTAPEGKSFSRVSYDGSAAQHFMFTKPTPGATNAKGRRHGRVERLSRGRAAQWAIIAIVFVCLRIVGIHDVTRRARDWYRGHYRSTILLCLSKKRTLIELPLRKRRSASVKNSPRSF